MDLVDAVVIQVCDTKCRVVEYGEWLVRFVAAAETRQINLVAAISQTAEAEREWRQKFYACAPSVYHQYRRAITDDWTA